MDHRARLLVALLLAAACEQTPAPTNRPVVDAAVASDLGVEAGTKADAPTGCAVVRGEVVSFTTSDGVRLEAELSTTGATGGAAAILLHMIPPSNDRSNYPRAFVDALVARGVTVLNVDRRGAGGSEGEARDAYLGPGGARDVGAAYGFLRAHPCAVDPTRVVLVGASNGSASIVDYAVAAEAGARPAAMVFLTGGTYTEAQTRFAAHRDRLDTVPILFVYSRVERAWSAALQPAAPAGWTFREYDPGAHGTGMFAPQPGAAGVIADFVANARR